MFLLYDMKSAFVVMKVWVQSGEEGEDVVGLSGEFEHLSWMARDVVRSPVFCLLVVTICGKGKAQTNPQTASTI